MNRICLTGNMVKDIEMKYTKNGKNYVENTIAVKKEKKDEDGNYESDFIDFVTFEKKADYLNTYSKKGDKIEIEGKLRVDKWKDDKDQYHNRMYVVCDKINILTSRVKTTKEESNPYEEMSAKVEADTSIEIPDDALPF